MSVLPSNRNLGPPTHREQSTPSFGAKPEQRAAFHRRREQEIDRISDEMRAQRARVLAALEHRTGGA